MSANMQEQNPATNFGKDLYVAIDIARKNNTVVFTAVDGKVLHHYQGVPNNPSGIDLVWQKTKELLSEYDLQTVLFGMETTGPYWFGPYGKLQNKCLVFSRGKYQVAALNPQIVHGFKDKFSYKKQKSDSKDAISIGRRLRFGEWDTSYVPTKEQLALRYYTRHRLHLVTLLSAEKLRFLSFLVLYCSEYEPVVKQEKIFATVFSQASLAILDKYATATELANAPLSELLGVVKPYTLTNRLTNLEEKLTRLQQAAANSYALPPAAQSPVHFILHQTLVNINFLTQQIKDTEKQIRPLFDLIDDPIKTIPGIGIVNEAGIWAETPDPTRYHYHQGQASLANYLGIISSMADTGEFHSTSNRMTKTGNAYGRHYYIEAANALRRFNPVFREYFLRKYAEAHPRRFKRSLGLTARKLIRIYYHLRLSKQVFQLPKTSAGQQPNVTAYRYDGNI